MRVKQGAFLLAGLLVGVVIGVLVVMSGPKSPAGAERRIPPSVGVAVRDFSLADVDSSQVKLSDYRGKAVLINFWATWCPPCKEEMPLLERYAQKYNGSLVVLGVNYLEQGEVVRSYRQENGVSFPLLLDPSGTVADLYYVRNFPTTFFVDADGILRGQHLGQLSEEMLVRYLKTIGVE
jgi:thiol-disulfide isomerase/thioredoxin